MDDQRYHRKPRFANRAHGLQGNGEAGCQRNPWLERGSSLVEKIEKALWEGCYKVIAIFIFEGVCCVLRKRKQKNAKRGGVVGDSVSRFIRRQRARSPDSCLLSSSCDGHHHPLSSILPQHIFHGCHNTISHAAIYRRSSHHLDIPRGRG
jgi:hypothetical protein